VSGYDRPMGKLSFALAVVIGLGSGACQPMYGAPPDTIHDPTRKKPPPPDPTADIAKITYIEDCELHTRVVKTPPHDVARAEQLVEAADHATAEATRTEEPAKKGVLLSDSVRQYGQALEKDPYSAETTLKLALAYDRVARKGCALALLGRLEKLSEHPQFAADATRQIDDVEINRTWFGGYRKDAMKAVGRP
jgi:hypothetical protein